MKIDDFSLKELLEFHPDTGRLLLGKDRWLLFRQEAFASLRRLMYEHLGETLANALLCQFGFASGWGNYEALTALYDWDSEMDALSIGPVMHAWEGIVHVEPEIMEFDRSGGHFYFKGIWRNSYEAEIHLQQFGKSDRPVCFSLAGYGSGWCTAFFERPLLEIETKCIACGDEYCAWIIKPFDEWGPEAGPWKQALSATHYSIYRQLEETSKRLSASKAKLEEYSRRLERMVEERTHELKVKNEELEKTLRQLRETQKQLIMQEKMASLGALTAGIAHEIKNPLNFVNNFAELSAELTRELRVGVESQKDRIDPRALQNMEEVLRDLGQNMTKINEHGQRADSIVRGMLLHSRGKSGERHLTDINALLDEYIKLAYHGMRARDSSFNITIATDYDPRLEPIHVVPQNLSRVFLNIVNNACYSAHEKRKERGDGYEPKLSVRTKSRGQQVEIRIRDNGQGIPAEARDKIFNPFFTTKPTGQGTGLGLSISYDIIVREHKGEIEVETEEGEYTEFIIRLPKKASRNRGVRE